MPDKAQQEHWDALLESTGEGIYGIGRDGSCTFVNRTATTLFGFSQEEMVGNDMHALTHHHHPDGREYPGEQCMLHAILHSDAPFRARLDTMFRKGGSSFLAEVSAHPVRVEGAVLGAVVTVRDVSAETADRAALDEAHRELAKRQAELKAVMESIPQGVYLARRDSPEISLNSRALALSGDSFPAQLRTLDLALAGESSFDVIEEGGRWLRSTATPVVLEDEVIGAVAINSDVTQTRLQDEALRKSEKLAAVGQLASSIAHEINNPLESVTNLLYLIRNTDEMGKVQEYSELAQAELARVSEITMQTLRFHRQQSRPVEIDLHELARTVMALYTGRLLVREIQLQWRLRAIPRVVGMEGELRQVLNNFVRNALDAMSSGGTLFLRLSPQREVLAPHRSGPGRPGVRITIADTGDGVDPRIASRLFEPFQTTKENTGTGLGLWVSRGILEKHGGRITMRTDRSAQRHGTVFSLWLPVGGAASPLTPEPR